jgi:hypothetical protein
MASTSHAHAKVGPTGLPATRSQECLCEEEDVAGSLAERRQTDIEDLEAIEEILPELAELDGFTHGGPCIRSNGRCRRSCNGIRIIEQVELHRLLSFLFVRR